MPTIFVSNNTHMILNFLMLGTKQHCKVVGLLIQVNKLVKSKVVQLMLATKPFCMIFALLILDTRKHYRDVELLISIPRLVGSNFV